MNKNNDCHNHYNYQFSSCRKVYLICYIISLLFNLTYSVDITHCFFLDIHMELSNIPVRLGQDKLGQVRIGQVTEHVFPSLYFAMCILYLMSYHYRYVARFFPQGQGAVVLNLGSIEPQGFGESVSGVRRFGSPRSFVH